MMNWGGLIYLSTIVLIGYLPYKTIQRLRVGGLSRISSYLAIILAMWFVILSFFLTRAISAFTYYKPAWSFVIFAVTSFIWFLSPMLIRKIGTYPKKHIESKPSWFVARFEYPTFYLKFFEVLFQQVIFLYFFAVVLIAMPFFDQILWFTLTIGFLHFANLAFLPIQEAWAYTILSFPMAFLFGLLIPNGLILITTSIHLWFYLLFGAYPWFKQKYAAPPINS